MITLLATSSLFTTHPQDQFIHINEDAMFECVANGSESLTISWTRNDGYNISKSHFKISSEITNGGRRSILKVKKSRIADSGFYRCIATNADSNILSSEQAELLSKIMLTNCNIILPLYHTVLPSIITHPVNVTILTGQSVYLTCSATGTDVEYQWMRNGVIISSDDNSNVLRINEIKQSDDGTYQCIASNKGGNATSNPARGGSRGGSLGSGDPPLQVGSYSKTSASNSYYYRR